MFTLYLTKEASLLSCDHILSICFNYVLFVTMVLKKFSGKDSTEKKERMTSTELNNISVEKHECGVGLLELTRQYNRCTSTICTILKEEKKKIK